MERLKKQIEAEFTQSSGCCAFLLINPRTGDSLAINEAESFPSASMIKVPIFYEIMRQVAAGKLDLQESIPLKPQQVVGGAGILMEIRPTSLTIEELANLMIVISDNTATNLLIERLGMAQINETMEQLNLAETRLQRKMMDFTAAQAGRENYSSPRDLVTLFRLIYDGATLPRSICDHMLSVLKRQQVRDKLPFTWPEEIPIAHKTGTLPGAEHDGGILYLPGGPYIVTIMTKNLTFNYEGLMLGARIGKILYEYFSGPLQTKEAGS
ncbi:MAG: serine hydrolase [Sporomusaceae bacterium]|nr:serine hydrolase [Sporomusaceae bacterium]